MTPEHIPLDLWALYVEVASVAIAPALGFAAFAVAWIVRPQSLQERDWGHERVFVGSAPDSVI